MQIVREGEATPFSRRCETGCEGTREPGDLPSETGESPVGRVIAHSASTEVVMARETVRWGTVPATRMHCVFCVRLDVAADRVAA